MVPGVLPNSGQVPGLLAAAVFGAPIGRERQLRGHPAGLHTNALVAPDPAAFVIASVLVGDNRGWRASPGRRSPARDSGAPASLCIKP